MNWRKFLTVKNILIISGCLYIIWSVERYFNKEAPNSSVIVKYNENKSEMQREVDKWKSKAEYYELLIEKNSVTIDAMDNNELDSVWAAIHR